LGQSLQGELTPGSSEHRDAFCRMLLDAYRRTSLPTGRHLMFQIKSGPAVLDQLLARLDMAAVMVGSFDG
jgi:hypothetical protein